MDFTTGHVRFFFLKQMEVNFLFWEALKGV